MSPARVSSHCSGIGPDKLILQGFLPAAINACGFPLEPHLKHHFSVEASQQSDSIVGFKSLLRGCHNILLFVCHDFILMSNVPFDLRQVTKDSDRGCQNVLTAYCHEPEEHVGVNVLDHSPSLRTSASDFMSWTLGDRIARVMCAPAADHKSIWCHRHQQYCRFHACDVDISGVPCVDFSPAGKQLGILGPSMLVILSLLSWHRQSCTKLIFLENVPEMPIEIVEQLMGDIYVIKAFYVEPSDAACEYLSRMRLFICLMRRGQSVFGEKSILLFYYMLIYICI